MNVITGIIPMPDSVITGITLVIVLFGLFTLLSIVVLSLVWIERKFLGRIQMRMGPMRVGFHGLLQPVADALKLVTKEDIIPSWVDRRVYWVAPLMVLVPSFMIWVTIPFARNMVVQNLELGLFYIIAFSVLSIVGMVVAGWGSANKYAILGGLRAAAQLISYEIPLIMAVLAVAMLVQSLNLTEIVDNQGLIPHVFLQPLGLFIFLIAGLAELGRTPFDIHHADSEIVGGPFVEYSGAHWSVFFLAEYINTFAIAALTVLLFLGGWRWPELPTPLAVIWFLAKTYLVILVIFWIRGTYPRLRIDQLMALGWKVLVPLSFINILITGIYLFYGWPAWTLTLMSLILLGGTFYLLYRKSGSIPERMTVRLHPVKRGA